MCIFKYIIAKMNSTIIYLFLGAVLFIILGKIASISNKEEYYIQSAFRDGIVGISMFGILMYIVPKLFPQFDVSLPTNIKIGGGNLSDYDLQIGLNPRA